MSNASRWRRFGFFDRSTLSLPDDVWDDLVPEDDSRLKKKLEDEAFQHTKLLHLACATVAFHPALIPQDKPPGALNTVSAAPNASAFPTDLTVSTTHSIPANAYFICSLQLSALGNRNRAFLTKPTGLDPLSPLNGSLAFAYCNGTGTAPPMSPVMEKMQSMFQLACAAGYDTASFAYVASGENLGSVAANLGTLVLAFISSPKSGLVHCVDVSMRCYPPIRPSATAVPADDSVATSEYPDSSPPQTEGKSIQVTSAPNAKGIPALADQMSAITMEELEDLDGWRGFVDPFAGTQPLKHTQPSSAKERIIQEHMTDLNKKPTIAAMAIYSEPRQTANSLLNKVLFEEKKAQGKIAKATGEKKIKPSLHDLVGHLYVAVVTNDPPQPDIPGICVMIDPHLRLQTDLANQSTSNEGLIMYRAKTAIKVKYSFTCIDVCPPYVVLGTTIGVTLVYTFTPLELVKSASSKTSALHDLTLKMEIPPPGISMNELSRGFPSVGPALEQVSSVRLAYDITSNTTESSEGVNNSEDRKEDEKQLTGSTGLVIGAQTQTEKNPSFLFVCYGQRQESVGLVGSMDDGMPAGEAGGPTSGGTTGVCCYNLLNTTATTSKTASVVPRSRVDLDHRLVSSSTLSDIDPTTGHLQVCWSDGLYTYSPTARIGAIPMEGAKIAFCGLVNSGLDEEALGVARKLPKDEKTMDTLAITSNLHPVKASAFLNSSASGTTSTMAYSLVATADGKSGRDAVDIYDTTNKLCAFHVLLSPNHRATQVAGVCTPTSKDGRKGRCSAIVISSGGAVITLTEKDTFEKVALLLQKNLYSAAISLAFADPFYPTSDIVSLYKQHAEYLYRKGDFEASIDQYIYTIGSIEPSHVIFRFLDAPKIPLLTKYLESLRQRNMASTVHKELLRTCYLKLNDLDAAEKIATSSAMSEAGSSVAVANLVADRPAEALATLCTLEPPQVAEALSVHGATLSRTLPRETAGIVMALCDGTFSPQTARGETADSNDAAAATLLRENNLFMENRPQVCERYPASLFTSAFVEHPKLLRLVLAHCKRNHCELSPSLRRTHLELTLEEWRNAKRVGDFEMEQIRSDEAMAALTDAHAEELGLYEALVLVQMAGFTKGEVLLFERLQMAPMLLERYSSAGGERERRQMIAMCRTDPELLADVIAYFVEMAGNHDTKIGEYDGESIDGDEKEDILDDIKETLEMARMQGVLPSVRITRILAGEGSGQFSSQEFVNNTTKKSGRHCVPLSVAMDYIGNILDESSSELSKLKDEIKEYSTACNEMEDEISALLSMASGRATDNVQTKRLLPELDLDALYQKLLDAVDGNNSGNQSQRVSLQAEEEFWREMGQSEDRFETIARFFAKGIIH